VVSFCVNKGACCPTAVIEAALIIFSIFCPSSVACKLKITYFTTYGKIISLSQGAKW